MPKNVVQDTFVKCCSTCGPGAIARPEGMAFTVAANGCRDRTRAGGDGCRGRPSSEERPAPPPAAADFEPALLALLTLAPRDRLLLSLRAQGLSYAEIARAAEIRPTSVGRLLARAVDRWKQSLKEKDDALSHRR